MKFAGRNLRIIMLLLIALLVVQTVAHTEELSLEPKVDERVELLAIIFHLAGTPEYNKIGIASYANDIDKYFEPYRTHPAVLMARELYKNHGVEMDAVMTIALSFSVPPDLTLVAPLNAKTLFDRWGKEDPSVFAAKVRNFYKITKFNDFFYAHKKIYNKAISKLQDVSKVLKLSWYQEFYGEPPAGKYNLLIGVCNGASCYGPNVVYLDGHEELFSIIGCGPVDKSGDPDFSGDNLGITYLSVIVHEFNHCFVNPLVAAHKDEFLCVKPIFDAVAKQMKRQAYGEREILVDESVVRAGVVLYMESRGATSKEIRNMIRYDQMCGFYWIDELCALLRQYQSQKEKYPTLRAFLPKVVDFFKTLAPHIEEKIASYNSKCVHVTAIRPFKNYSQSVDPKISEITVGFDKTLSPGCIAVCSGQSGRRHNPALPASVKILPGNKSCKLSVKLKSHWNYELVMYSPLFCTEDCYPLIEYKIAFKTK